MVENETEVKGNREKRFGDLVCEKIANSIISM